MRTKRLTEYRAILLQLHHSQVERLDKIKELTGKSRVEIIREAVAIELGNYDLALKEGAKWQQPE